MLRKFLSSGIKRAVRHKPTNLFHTSSNIMSKSNMRIFSPYRLMSTDTSIKYRLHIPFEHSNIKRFISKEKWFSYPEKIREELMENVFSDIDSGDNYGGVVDAKYAHLFQIIKDGYLNFDTYAAMSNDARLALLNLVWHSSVYQETGGVWALKQKLFTVEEFLSFSKACQNDLIKILNEESLGEFVYANMTASQKINAIQSYLNDMKILNDIIKDQHLLHNIENKAVPTLAKLDPNLGNLSAAAAEHLKDLIAYKISKASPEVQTKIRLHLENSVIEWNRGHVPEFSPSIPKDSDVMNTELGSKSPMTANITWEFDPRRSLYFYRRPNSEGEKNKANQEPVKETDSMVVFSLTKK